MGNNPYDPRDPLSPAFYLTFIADRNGGGSPRGGGSGQGLGCAATVLAVLLATVLVGALASVFTR
jgi:hypothetical protein